MPQIHNLHVAVANRPLRVLASSREPILNPSRASDDVLTRSREAAKKCISHEEEGLKPVEAQKLLGISLEGSAG